jgi:predicted RNA binding protein YcfA (HicA-like mRNA interferase family)
MCQSTCQNWFCGQFPKRKKGSHIILVRQVPKTRLSVPNHQELDRGTLRAIIRQAGLTVDEFIALL